LLRDYHFFDALEAWNIEHGVEQDARRIGRIAIVAVARKLLIAQWRYMETGVVPAGAELNASKH
jgi:transposase